MLILTDQFSNYTEVAFKTLLDFFLIRAVYIVSEKFLLFLRLKDN
jgi:hypothetical protein